MAPAPCPAPPQDRRPDPAATTGAERGTRPTASPTSTAIWINPLSSRPSAPPTTGSAPTACPSSQRTSCRAQTAGSWLSRSICAGVAAGSRTTGLRSSPPQGYSQPAAKPSRGKRGCARALHAKSAPESRDVSPTYRR